MFKQQIDDPIRYKCVFIDGLSDTFSTEFRRGTSASTHCRKMWIWMNAVLCGIVVVDGVDVPFQWKKRKMAFEEKGLMRDKGISAR